MLFRYDSHSHQANVAWDDSEELADLLLVGLADNPVLQHCEVGFAHRPGGGCVIGIRATVAANNDKLAVIMALNAADEQWRGVLAEVDCDTAICQSTLRN